MSRYRRLRGFAIHCLPMLREGEIPTNRKLLDAQDLKGPKTPGICRWCRLPVTSKRRQLWDDECKKQHLNVIGWRVDPLGTQYRGDKYIDNRVCARCGGTDRLEIEHHLSLSVARILGVKAMIHAYTLENLRWLCHDCHAAKTRTERQLIAWSKRPPAPDPEPDPQLAFDFDFGDDNL